MIRSSAQWWTKDENKLTNLVIYLLNSCWCSYSSCCVTSIRLLVSIGLHKLFLAVHLTFVFDANSWFVFSPIWATATVSTHQHSCSSLLFVFVNGNQCRPSEWVNWWCRWVVVCWWTDQTNNYNWLTFSRKSFVNWLIEVKTYFWVVGFWCLKFNSFCSTRQMKIETNSTVAPTILFNLFRPANVFSVLSHEQYFIAAATLL